MPAFTQSVGQSYTSSRRKRECQCRALLGRTLTPCIDDVVIRNILGGTSICPSKDTNERKVMKVCGHVACTRLCRCCHSMLSPHVTGVPLGHRHIFVSTTLPTIPQTPLSFFLPSFLRSFSFSSPRPNPNGHSAPTSDICL